MTPAGGHSLLRAAKAPVHGRPWLLDGGCPRCRAAAGWGRPLAGWGARWRPGAAAGRIGPLLEAARGF